MKKSVRLLLCLAWFGCSTATAQIPFFGKKPQTAPPPHPLNLPNTQTQEKSMFALPKLPWSKDKTHEAMEVEPMQDKDLTPEQKLEGQVALARLTERRGKVELAEKMYRSIAAQQPRLVLPHHRLGVMEAKRGKYDQADEHFQNALRIEPRNLELLNDAGYSCYLQNRFEEAESLYRKAMAIDANDSRTCNNYGLLLAETGRIQESIAIFRKTTSESEAYANVGYVLTQLGEFDEARKHFDYALTLDPNQRRAAHALLQLAEQDEKAKLASLAPHRNPDQDDPQSLDALVQGEGAADRSIAAQSSAPLKNPSLAPAGELPSFRSESSDVHAVHVAGQESSVDTDVIRIVSADEDIASNANRPASSHFDTSPGSSANASLPVRPAEMVKPVYRSGDDPALQRRAAALKAAEEALEAEDGEDAENVASESDASNRAGAGDRNSPHVSIDPRRSSRSSRPRELTTDEHLAPIVTPQEMQQMHMRRIQRDVIGQPAGALESAGGQLNLNPHARLMSRSSDQNEQGSPAQFSEMPASQPIPSGEFFSTQSATTSSAAGSSDAVDVGPESSKGGLRSAGGRIKGRISRHFGIAPQENAAK